MVDLEEGTGRRISVGLGAESYVVGVLTLANHPPPPEFDSSLR